MSFKKLSYLCIALGLGCAMTFASCGDDDKDNKTENGTTENGNNQNGNNENGNNQNGNNGNNEQQAKDVKEGDPCSREDFKEFCNDEGKLVLCEEKEQNSKESVITFFDCSIMNGGDDHSGDEKYICATFDKAGCFQTCSENEKGTLNDFCDSEEREYTRLKCEMSKESKLAWNFIGSEKCEGSDVACCAELNGNNENQEQKEETVKAGDPCSREDFKEFCNDEGKLVLCEKDQNSDDPVIFIYDCSMMNGGDDHSGDETFICATFDETSCFQTCSESEEGTLKDYCDPEERDYSRLKCEMSKESKLAWNFIGSGDCEGSDVACCAELKGDN